MEGPPLMISSQKAFHVGMCNQFRKYFFRSRHSHSPTELPPEWAGDTGEEDSQRKGNILGPCFSPLASPIDQEQGACAVVLASFLYRLTAAFPDLCFLAACEEKQQRGVTANHVQAPLRRTSQRLSPALLLRTSAALHPPPDSPLCALGAFL